MELNRKKPFVYTALGGTFDRLHIGHKKLINTAFKVSEKVLIGVTSDQMLKSKENSEKIQDYSLRIAGISKYIEDSNLSINRVDFYELTDPFGPAISEKKLDALVCSTETYPNALEINKIRVDNMLNPLILIVIPLILNSNHQKISSSLIRSKLI